MKPDKDKLGSALVNGVKSTIEKMAFLSIDSYKEMNNSEGLSNDKIHLTTIELRSPFKARLGFLIDKELVKKIVVSMTGDLVDNFNDYYCDMAMAEVSNIIAGRFLAVLTPYDQEIAFSLPTVGFVVPERTLSRLNGNSTVFEFTHDNEKFYCFYELN